MKMREHQSQDLWWEKQIALHGAVRIGDIAEAKLHPDSAVAFETENFGYIFSARGGENQSRKLLCKY